MKEIFEFRTLCSLVREFLPEIEAVPMSDYSVICQLFVTKDDALFTKMATVHQMLRKQKRGLYSYWQVRRTYSKKEFASASLFQLDIKPIFGPSGEECGSIYDERTACPICGIDASLVGSLKLDVARIPRSQRIARSTGNEVVVSQSLAERMIASGLTGFRLHQVEDVAVPHTSVDLKTVPSGLELLDKAHARGIMATDSGMIAVFLNLEENHDLYDAAVNESQQRELRQNRGRRLPPWYRLDITSPRIIVGPETRFGDSPFTSENSVRCPLGHVGGFHQISEMFLDFNSYSGHDVVEASIGVGPRLWPWRPTRSIFVSSKFRDLILAEKCREIRFEIPRSIERDHAS